MSQADFLGIPGDAIKAAGFVQVKSSNSFCYFTGEMSSSRIGMLT
jgi:hypothetical protein